MAAYVWYITPIVRSGGNWVTNGASQQITIWFGSSPPPPTDTTVYSAIIIDNNPQNGLVNTGELRDGFLHPNASPAPNLVPTSNNPASLGTAEVTVNTANGPVTINSIAYRTATSGPNSINSTNRANLITLEPIDSSTFASAHQPGTGNFQGFNPGTLTEDPVPCFVAGTLIETPDGPRPVEALRPGDLVSTADGPLPLAWVGRVRVAGQGRYAPILIRAGALGNRRDLRVSPQHRMVIRSDAATLMFGAREVLVAACHLVDGRTILPSPCETVDYVHLLFDRHAIVYAEGAASESLHPGDYMLGEAGFAARHEILALFPALQDAALARTRRTVLPVLRRYEAAVLRAL